MSALHSAKDTFDATATGFVALLNVPSKDAAAGGYIELTATNAIVQFEIASWVDRVERKSYVLAGPGEPAQFAALPAGFTISYRPVHLTTYEHDADGGATATAASSSPRSCSAFYLAGQPLPSPGPKRIVADRRLVQAGTWAAASGYISIPLGPPGLWRARHVYCQLESGSPVETSFEVHIRTGKAGVDTPPIWVGRTGSVAPSTTWVGARAPNELESSTGPDMSGYMPNGWAHLYFAANASLDPSSVYFFESIWEYEGLAMPLAFLDRVVVS